MADGWDIVLRFPRQRLFGKALLLSVAISTMNRLIEIRSYKLRSGSRERFHDLAHA